MEETKEDAATGGFVQSKLHFTPSKRRLLYFNLVPDYQNLTMCTSSLPLCTLAPPLEIPPEAIDVINGARTLAG